MSLYRMQKCFQQGSGMENLNKGDDKQKCAIVNQFSLCFKEIPDCETEIKGLVRELSSVSQQLNVIGKNTHDCLF